MTARLWIAKDTGALLQEGVSLSNQVELTGGLGFNGRFVVEFQRAAGPVTITSPVV